MTNPIIIWTVAVLGSYLLGSIPTGVIVVRLMRGVDVRDYGSGSTGATNVSRVSGIALGLIVLFIDFIKGAAAIVITLIISGEPFPSLSYTEQALPAAIASSAVVAGHLWPVWAGFRGGRGIMTGLGVVAVFAPIAALVVLIGPLTAARTKYVSLGSMVGVWSCFFTIVGFVAAGVYGWEYIVFAVPLALVMTVRHLPNIKRLIAGTESKFGETSSVKHTKT